MPYPDLFIRDLAGPAALPLFEALMEVCFQYLKGGAMTLRCAPVLTALALMCSVGAATAGPNANAKLAIHLASTTTKNACTSADARPDCLQALAHGSLYPALYFAYALVVDGNAPAGIGSASFGIDYDGAVQSGVDVYSWTFCGDSESPEIGWPSPGTGNVITWDAATNCQRLEPGGAGTGVTASLGFFYLAAYSSDFLKLTGSLSDGAAHIQDCSGIEDVIAEVDSCNYRPFGLAGFGDYYGFNPCGGGPNCPCTTIHVSGPSVVSPGSTGNVYTVSEAPGFTQVLWSISGAGSIAGPTDENTVSVNAGPSGSYSLKAVRTIPHASVWCTLDVLIDTGVPAESSTWGGVKALFR